MANPYQPDPRYFDFGNAFLGGMQQSQDNNRRNQLVGIEQQQANVYQQRAALEQDEYLRSVMGQQQAAQKRAAAIPHMAKIFVDKLQVSPEVAEMLADSEGAEELAQELLTRQPEQADLITDASGVRVPDAPGVRPYQAPQAPKGPGTLYQVVGPDGAPRFVSAEEAIGQQPFLKKDAPPVEADPASKAQNAENVLAAIGDAEKLMAWNTTGFIGQKLGEVGGTDAYALRQALDTVKGNIGFDRLQKMREESKTGGALGAVAVRELDLLMSTMGSLDANMGTPQLSKNLARVKKQYLKAMEAYQAAIAQKAGAPASGGPGRAPSGAAKRVKVDAEGNVIGN